MRKSFSFFLILSVLFSAGCSAVVDIKNETDELDLTVSTFSDTVETKEKPKKPLPNWDVKKTEESAINDDKENALPMNPEYTEITLDLKNQTSTYKTFGRTYFSEKGLSLDFGGNGFEFVVECGGDVYLTYSSLYKTYFQSFVDGEPAIRFSTAVNSDQKIRIARNLPDGLHTIRVVRDSDAAAKPYLMAISSVCFFGKADTLRAPAENNLFIEFVGDSITAGKYSEMKYIEGDAIHKATNSYAYLTSVALNADYSMIARGGCGYFRVSTCPKTMNQLYPYYNGFQNEPVPYSPSRKADIVVLALGTNDTKANVEDSYKKGVVPFAAYEEALADQIRLIRSMHGENVPIILMCGMMTNSWETELKNAAQADNVYFLKVTKNRGGGKNHPSAEGHKVIASELTKFIQENLL